MRERKISPFDFSVAELDSEMIARCASIPGEELFKFSSKGTAERDAIMERVKEIFRSPPPLNPAMKNIETEYLVKALMFKIGKMEIDGVR